MVYLCTLAVGTPRVPMVDHKPTLHQAGVVGGVVAHILLHVGPEPLEPGGLAVGALVLLLRISPLLQDPVETEVEILPGSSASWSLGFHDEHHVRGGPAL